MKLGHRQEEPQEICTAPGSAGDQACGSSHGSLYASAGTMGKKQEELEIYVWPQGHDLIVITETWWDRSYDWNVMEGYVCFRKDKPAR